MPTEKIKSQTLKIINKALVSLLYLQITSLVSLPPDQARSEGISQIPPNHQISSFDVSNLSEKGVQALKEGRYLDAVAIWEKLNEWALKNLGDNDINYIYGLNALATAYRSAGMNQKAEKLINKTQRLIKKAGINDSILLAATVNNQALVKFELGELESAEILARKALDLWLIKGGKADIMAITISTNIANILEKQGNQKEALNQYLIIKETIINEYGNRHSLLGKVYTSLAHLYAETGEYGQAETIIKIAIQINNETHSKHHSNKAETFNTYGNILSRQGRLNEAIKFYDDALNIYKLSGKKGSYLPVTIGNIAMAYLNLGLLQEAKKKSEEGLSLLKDNVGINNATYANALSNHSLILDKLNMDSQAVDAAKKALSMKIEFLGEDHISTILSYNNLGNMLLSSDNSLEEGYQHLSKSWKLSQENQIVSRLAQAAAMHNIGIYWDKKGDIQKATKSFRKVLELVDKNSHLRYTVLYNLGTQLLLSGGAEAQEGRELIRQGIELASYYYQREAQFVPNSIRKDMFKQIDLLYNAGLSIPRESSKESTLSLFTRFNLHGRLEEIEKKQALMSSSSAEVKALRVELKGIAHLLSSPNLRKGQREKLLSKQKNIETQLYRLLPQLKPRIISVDEVARLLPKNSLLIDFQRHYPIQKKIKDATILEEPYYKATLLKANGTSFRIDLGKAREIDMVIHQLLGSIEEGLSDSQVLLDRASEIILNPLNKYISDADELFIIPDGQLNRIPFAALTIDNGKNVGEIFKLRILSSGRDLINLKSKAKAADQSIIIFADPDFGFSKQELKANYGLSHRQSETTSIAPSIAKISQTKWERILHTQKEGRSIQSLIGGQLWTEKEASETKVKSSGSPKILHLATHAYYLPDISNNPQSQTFSTVNPLVRSGVVLAGANTHDLNYNDDGFLTALEITQLNLNATELVVISACESGLGEISSNEGVYGLRRSIAVAGARSSLLSLWKVDDEATAAFMTSFYTRLKAKMGRGDALSATQKEFRSHPNEDWREPYVWAAFQLSGDWGPIEGL